MPRCNGELYVAVPKMAKNSCKGCCWYPNVNRLYKSIPNSFIDWLHNYSSDESLLKGCMTMHDGLGSSICKELNIIFTKVSNKNEK